MEKTLQAAALGLGALITWFDSRLNFGDTGVTAGILFVAAAAFSYFAPRRPWLWALLLAGGIPLLGIARSGNYGSLLALAIALVGAYGGMGIRRLRAPTGRDDGR